ncbi:hypothetical protein M422DRAFT_275639 [Sphaerobolus stellatus SS14]|uniref:Uncharacterized protein n=1 Tax=Sphaerobolus stellatus (strain SS14) TaxID=990650 RepID=A0A0C9U3L1_SPHS4|nr:hypothetical protein M422DRAFT_275639 [Sphaerobolus stellatus SS14]
MLLFAWITFLYGLLSAQATPASNSGFDIGQFLQLNLVTHINAFLTLESLTTNMISINFDGESLFRLE